MYPGFYILFRIPILSIFLMIPQKPYTIPIQKLLWLSPILSKIPSPKKPLLRIQRQSMPCDIADAIIIATTVATIAKI